MNNMNRFYVYMLRCSDCSYYTGHTDDLEKRLVEHNAGQYGGYTAERLPVELVFVQGFETRDEAFVAEHKIKKWTRIKKEALIQSHWERLKALSKKKFKP
jgi:predicted GIY-YIG superfamily endonuclease